MIFRLVPNFVQGVFDEIQGAANRRRTGTAGTYIAPPIQSTQINKPCHRRQRPASDECLYRALLDPAHLLKQANVTPVVANWWAISWRIVFFAAKATFNTAKGCSVGHKQACGSCSKTRLRCSTACRSVKVATLQQLANRKFHNASSTGKS